MKNVNPTETNAWQKLSNHSNDIKNIHLKTCFNDNSNRKNDFSINVNNFEFDYSKNRLNQQTIDLLLELAN